MKSSKSTIVSLLLVLFISASAMAQSGAKVITVVNKASWCPVCQKNGKRAMSVLMAGNQNGVVQFVTNDLSNEKTIQTSAEKLKELNLYQTMKKYKSTGMVYFFDAGSKTLISEISLAQSNQKLARALLVAKKMAQ